MTIEGDVYVDRLRRRFKAVILRSTSAPPRSTVVIEAQSLGAVAYCGHHHRMEESAEACRRPTLAAFGRFRERMDAPWPRSTS
jgi:hypothetical protein